MTNPCDLDAVDARRMIGNKTLSPVELLDSCLDRIAKINPDVNAIVAMDAEAARLEAKEAEKDVMSGANLGVLHGLPVGVKDLEATAGLTTTWGSLIYKDHVPDKDDEMVANVRAAGANIFAKTNTPEFGAGANTKNRVYGATGNPFDTVKTCAGSSGGSAAALATGMCSLATGSDYGGSLRTPAAFCGIVGFRPSPGLVPSPFRAVSHNPFSVLGPMARTVSDLFLLLRAQVDFDLRDPYSRISPLESVEQLQGADLASVRVAISPDLGCSPVAKTIRRSFAGKVDTFKHVFASADQRDPAMQDVHECFEILRCVNFVAAHQGRLENQRDLLGPNVIDNTERGQNYSLKDVAWAHTVQSRIHADFNQFFEESDILICPTAAVSPFPHEQLSVNEIDGESMPTYMRWLSLSYALTTAVPVSCSLPCGVDENGMPFGIQVVGPNGSDEYVLQVALSLEKVLAANPQTQRPIPAV